MMGMNPNMMMNNGMGGNMNGMAPNMMNNGMAGNFGMMDPMNMNMMNMGGMAGMGGMGGMGDMGGMAGMGGMGGMGGMAGMGGMGSMPGMGGMGGMGDMGGMAGIGGMGGIAGMGGMAGMGGIGNMAGMPGFGNGNNLSMDDASGWNLVFENQNDKQKYTVTISEQKTIKEAISIYRIKSNNNDPCKFIVNSKQLFPEMRICESGLQNNSRILVISTRNLKGAYSTN